MRLSTAIWCYMNIEFSIATPTTANKQIQQQQTCRDEFRSRLMSVECKLARMPRMPFYERFHSFRLCLLLCFANAICGSCSNSVSHNFRRLFLFTIVREIYVALLLRFFPSIIGFRLFQISLSHQLKRHET